MNAGSFFSKIVIAIPFLFMCFGAMAQELEVDSTKTVVVDEVKEEEVHSPKRATIYSAILPGLGQAYNRKYWKIPIIYAGFGTIGYFIGWNNDNYQVMKQAYRDFTDDDETTNSYVPLNKGNYDLTREPYKSNFRKGLERQQEYYRRNRDLLIISIFGFYGLNLIDASVDAHFFDFDISEDLTFNWQPSMHYFNNQPVYGLNATFTF